MRSPTPASNLLSDLGSIGWETRLTPESYETISQAGFRGANRIKAAQLCDLSVYHEPITLRGLLYQAVSAGVYPSTDKEHYNNAKRLTGSLRKKGIMPYKWLVDSLRTTHKPSSWAGLGEFTETVRHAYRKNFWHYLDWCVHIISEKDAIAGTIQSVTEEYDVALSPIRGNTSHSFAYELGTQFKRTRKPIFIGYLGDFDPTGMDIERDLQAKLHDHSGRKIVRLPSGVTPRALDFDSTDRTIVWQRLAVDSDDIAAFNLLPLSPKASDSRSRRFVEKYGQQCTEVDALPPNELRKRVREAIEQFIPQEEWARLKQNEELERQTFQATLDSLSC